VRLSTPRVGTLAFGSRDCIIALWDVDNTSWQSRACHIANRNLTPEESQVFI
jgi:hypothetical protein